LFLDASATINVVAPQTFANLIGGQFLAGVFVCEKPEKFQSLGSAGTSLSADKV